MKMKTRMQLEKDLKAYKQLAKKYLQWYHCQLETSGKRDLSLKYKRELDKTLTAEFNVLRVK